MSYITLTETMLAMLNRCEGYGYPLTLSEMVGREPTATDRKEFFKLWLNDLLRVAPAPNEDYGTITCPFHYVLTDQGHAKLKRIREGEATDRYEASLERVRRDNEGAEVVVVPDRGQSKRSLAIVMRDGEPDYYASRWTYSTGAFRRPTPTEIDDALEGARS